MKRIASLNLIASLLLALGACSFPWQKQAQRSTTQAQRTTVVAQEHSTGLKLLDEAEYRSIPLALLPVGGELPSQVDLSRDMPPVGNQGQQESCVGWAVSYALRTYLARREQGWDVNAPTNQFSPAYVYNQIVRGNCRTGVNFVEAFNLLTREGNATLAAMPYNETDCAQQPSPWAKEQARAFRLAFYRRVNVQDTSEVKAQLAAGFPVLIAVANDSNLQALGREQIWQSKGTPSGFHAVTLVGYDDARQAFRLLNSWGTDWGTDGYGWIAYDWFRQVTREGYIAAAFRAQPQPTTTPVETTTVPQVTPSVIPPVLPQPAPQASIQIIGVDHNINANTPSAGMNVRLRYTLRGFQGNNGQIALHFWYPNNQPVGAALAEYRDIYNNAAVGTQVFAIPGNDYTNYEFTLFVPYAALQVPVGGFVWNGTAQVYQYQRTDLRLVADLFVNNFGVAQSLVVNFYVNR